MRVCLVYLGISGSFIGFLVFLCVPSYIYQYVCSCFCIRLLVALCLCVLVRLHILTCGTYACKSTYS